MFPQVKWAQSKNGVVVTFEVRNVDRSALIVELVNPSTLSFKTKEHDLQLTLFAEVSSMDLAVSDREIRAHLAKQDTTAAFWPRLLQTEARVPWLKVDFTRWVNEEEEPIGLSGSPFDGYDFSQFDQQMPMAGDSDCEDEKLCLEDKPETPVEEVGEEEKV